jgi:hypothetical protein
MGLLDFFLNGNNDKHYNQELGNLDEFGDELEQLKSKDVRKEKLMEYEYLSDEDINREN